MIKTIIIEDEQPARDLIRNYLKDAAQIELVGEFSDGFTGLKAIQELKPQLVFLDIQMPKLTGFELVELLDEIPQIIFTTAYDQFAIRAFELNAVDYLLKPYARDRFNLALNKAIERISASPDTKKVHTLVQHIAESREKLDRIVVKTGPKIKVIAIEDIQYIESQDDYVMIYTREGKYLKQQTMKSLENALDPKLFSRIHRSYMVNIECITQLELYEKGSYLAVLSSGAKLKVSDTGYKMLKSLMRF